MPVRYNASAGQYLWPIPFAPHLAGARLQYADGREAELAQGKDYMIEGGNVVCIVPPGASLILYEKTAPNAALAAPANTASNVAYVPESVSDYAAPAASDAAPEATAENESGNVPQGTLRQSVSNPRSAATAFALSDSISCASDGLNDATEGNEAAGQNVPRGTLRQATSNPPASPCAPCAAAVCISGNESQNVPRGTERSYLQGMRVQAAACKKTFLPETAGAKEAPAAATVSSARIDAIESVSQYLRAPVFSGISDDIEGQNVPRGTALLQTLSPCAVTPEAAVNNVASETLASVSAGSSVDETVSQNVPRGTAASMQAAGAQTGEQEVAAQSELLAAIAARLDAMDEAVARQIELERQKQSDAQLSRIAETGSEAEAKISASAVSASAALASAIQTAQADLQADAGQAQSRITETTNACEQRLAALLVQIDRRMTALQEQVSQLDLASASAAQSISAAAAEAQAQTQAASRLAGQAWPMQGYMVLASDLAAGSVTALPEPLSYYPGRNSLFIARNGFVLTLGRDFNEVGSGAASSNTIRLLNGAGKGDVLSFLIVPTNAAQAAADSAREAEAASFEASRQCQAAAAKTAEVTAIADKAVTEGQAKLDEITSQASTSLRNLSLTADIALSQISQANSNARADCVQVWQTATADIRKLGQAESDASRQLWQKAQADIAGARQEALSQAQSLNQAMSSKAASAESFAGDAKDLARCAWQAAWQASLAAARPGLASVPRLSELDRHPSGLYIVNPLLVSHTPFMGIWPVRSFSEAVWDGFFFLGVPYPDQPDLPEPPPYPEDPAEVPAMRPASQGNWLPCDHSHNQKD